MTVQLCAACRARGEEATRRPRREEAPATGETGPLSTLQRLANAGAGARQAGAYRAMLGRAAPGSVVQRVDGEDDEPQQTLGSGQVVVDHGGRRIILASQDRADDYVRRHPDTLRVNMVARGGDSLEDAVADPNQWSDLPNLVAAHAARVGQTEGEVCINCKSGKTRTPVVAIAHLIMSGLTVEAAVKKVADAYQQQRPGVGIDYDSKLTGRRLLDAEGNTAPDPGSSPLLKAIYDRYGASLQGPSTAEAWREVENTVRSGSTQLGSRRRLTRLWRAFEGAKAQENQRRQPSGASSSAPTPSSSSSSEIRRDEARAPSWRERLGGERRGRPTRTPLRVPMKRQPKRALRNRRTEVARLLADFNGSPYWKKGRIDTE